RINAQIGDSIPQNIGGMHVVWIVKRCSRGILNQVVAIRDEGSRNVWADLSVIASNNTVSQRYLAGLLLVTASNCNPAATCRVIAVNGTKGDAPLTLKEEEAATIGAPCVARDYAVE